MSEENTPQERWAQPRSVSQTQEENPSIVIGTYLPLWDEIPQEFKEEKNAWRDKASRLYDQGGASIFRADVDQEMAIKHLVVCLRSPEPTDGHRMAGIGFLLSLWCGGPPMREEGVRDGRRAPSFDPSGGEHYEGQGPRRKKLPRPIAKKYPQGGPAQ